MLPYTENEICALYRVAADKPQQIKILAELNNTSKEKVKEILIKYGYKVDFAPKPKQPKKFMSKEEREKRVQAYRKYCDLGYSAKETAKIMGIKDHNYLKKHAKSYGIVFTK